MQIIHKMLIVTMMLVLVGYWVWHHTIIDTPIHFEADPEYAYMLSSLSVFDGEPYVYLDHPGTPLLLTGSALFAASIPFVDGDLATTHLEHPEYFLLSVHFLLLLLHLITFYIITRHALLVEHPTDALAAAAVPAVFFAVHPWSVQMLTIWTHNAFNFPIGCLLLFWLLKLLENGHPLAWRAIGGWGIAAGLLVSVQVYFATWVIGGIVAFGLFSYFNEGRIRRALEVMLSVGAFSLVGFFGIIAIHGTHLDYFFDWIFSLASSQDYHGGGEAGITSMGQIQTNFSRLLQQIPIFVIVFPLVVLFSAIVGVWQRQRLRQSTALLAFFLAMWVQLIVTMALIFTSYRSIYMLAPSAIIPFLLLVSFRVMDLHKPPARLTYFALSIVILFLFAGSVIRMGEFQAKRVHQWERGESQIAAYLTEDGAPRDIARSIGSFSDCHGLWYGNLYANYTFTDQITHICPNEAYFDPWRLQYQAASSWNPSQEHLLIISYYAYNANPAVLRPGEDFEVLEDAELILVRSNGVDDQAE